MARKTTYQGLLHQRTLVAGLTLGLVAVMIGVSVDLIFTGQRSTIPATTQRLIVPLDPQLDISVIEAVEGYQEVTVEEARQGVSQPVTPSPEPILESGFFDPSTAISTEPTPEPTPESATLFEPLEQQTQQQGTEPVLQP